MPVDPESIGTLSKTPPPAGGRYWHCKDAAARIEELRKQLNITEPEVRTFNVGKLNNRIRYLEGRLHGNQTSAALPEKDIFSMDVSEIGNRCKLLESELALPTEAVSADLTLARSRLLILESEKLSRASKKFIASLPPVPISAATATPPPVTVPTALPAQELKGRNRFVAACRIHGADRESPVIDSALRGRARMKAAIAASGIIDLTQSDAAPATDAIAEAEQPEKELFGRDRMKASIKIQNVTTD
jgi:hypothetical protein